MVKKKEVRESGREGRVRERRKHMVSAHVRRVSGRPVVDHGRTGRPGDREVMGQDPANETRCGEKTIRRKSPE